MCVYIIYIYIDIDIDIDICVYIYISVCVCVFHFGRFKHHLNSCFDSGQTFNFADFDVAPMKFRPKKTAGIRSERRPIGSHWTTDHG